MRWWVLLIEVLPLAVVCVDYRRVWRGVVDPGQWLGAAVLAMAWAWAIDTQVRG